tara:strand:+ start:66 stop:413 length:348 start_codon:yes stop_codon:yes gene_type:complete
MPFCLRRLAGALLAAAFLAAFFMPAQAETRKIRWACQDWESHNAHFEPAAHFKFSLAKYTVIALVNAGRCSISDFWYTIEPVALIGSIPHSGRIAEGWIVRLANGKLIYTVWHND